MKKRTITALVLTMIMATVTPVMAVTPRVNTQTGTRAENHGVRRLENTIRFDNTEHAKPRVEVPEWLATDPSDCSPDAEPDLSVDGVVFTGIDYTDNNEIVYLFDVTIKNDLAPLLAKSVWLNTYSANDMPLVETYGDIDEHTAKHAIKLTNHANYVQLDCGESMTVSGVAIPVAMSQNITPLVFVVDAFNVVTEYNEVGDVFVFTSNNVFEYDVEHPFLSFTLNDISVGDGSLQFKAGMNSVGSDSVYDLQVPGNYFAVSIAPGLSANTFLSQEVVIDEASGAQFAKGFLQPGIEALTDADFDSTDILLQLDKNWLSDTVEISTTGQPTMILLTLYSAKLAKHIPVYGYMYITPEIPVDIVSCPVGDPTCLPENYLLVTASGPSHTFIDPLSTVGTTTEVGQFSICKMGPSTALLESIRIHEQFEHESEPYIKRYFTMDGDLIWEPLTYDVDWFSSGKFISAQKTKIHDITLKESSIIESGNCVSIETSVSDVNGFLFWSTMLSGIDSTVPAFVYHDTLDTYFRIGAEQYETYEPIFKPYSAIGSIAVFDTRSGYNITFLPNEVKANTNYDNLVNMVEMKIETEQYQNAVVDSLEFGVVSDLTDDPGTLQGYVVVGSVGPWDYKVPPEFEFDDFDTPEKFTNITLIDVPTNGEFSIPVDASLSYGQYMFVKVFIMAPSGMSGDMDVSLVETKPMYEDSRYIAGVPIIEADIFSYINGVVGSLPLTRHIIFDSGMGDVISVNIYPQGNWSQWIAGSKYTEKKLLEIGVNLKTADYEKMYDIGPITAKVMGSFEKPVMLRVETGPGYGMIEDVEIIEVLPGDIITFHEAGQLSYATNPFSWTSVQFQEYPDVDTTGFIFFLVDPIKSLDEPATSVIVSKEKPGGYEDVPFVEPIKGRAFSFGKELLYQSGNYNSPIPKFVDIATIADEEVLMNDTCFTAQGEVEIYGAVYAHDEHDDQPFDKVLLSMWDTTYYLPIDAWTTFEAEFNTASGDNPFFVYNGSEVCLNMRVQKPKMPLNNTFFNLISIDARIPGTDLPVPIVLQTGDLLSDATQVKGTVTNFY